MKLSPLMLLPFLFVGVACSSYRPVVDENAQYQKVGSARAESDIDDCMAKADRFLESHKSDRMMKEAGRGAASGAIIGGVVGLMTGDAKTALGGAALGAGVGAASRAAGEATKDKLTPDRMKKNYVSNCLKRKNYVVIGWK